MQQLPTFISFWLVQSLSFVIDVMPSLEERIEMEMMFLWDRIKQMKKPKKKEKPDN
jgi:hypothetical protein